MVVCVTLAPTSRRRRLIFNYVTSNLESMHGAKSGRLFFFALRHPDTGSHRIVARRHAAFCDTGRGVLMHARCVMKLRTEKAAAPPKVT